MSNTLTFMTNTQPNFTNHCQIVKPFPKPTELELSHPNNPKGTAGILPQPLILEYANSLIVATQFKLIDFSCALNITVK